MLRNRAVTAYKGAWARALRERFASAPLRIQERTDWPLPGANTLRFDGAKFLLFVVYSRLVVGGGVPDAPANARTLRADIESAPTVRTKGCDNRKVARGVEDAAPYGLHEN